LAQRLEGLRVPWIVDRDDQLPGFRIPPDRHRERAVRPRLRNPVPQLHRHVGWSERAPRQPELPRERAHELLGCEEPELDEVAPQTPTARALSLQRDPDLLLGDVPEILEDPVQTGGLHGLARGSAPASEL